METEQILLGAQTEIKRIITYLQAKPRIQTKDQPARNRKVGVSDKN